MGVSRHFMVGLKTEHMPGTTMATRLYTLGENLLLLFYEMDIVLE